MELPGHGSTQQWIVRNTFIEPVEDPADIEDGFALRRCNSDSVLTSSSSNSTRRHSSWVSSSESQAHNSEADNSEGSLRDRSRVEGDSSSRVEGDSSSRVEVDLSSRVYSEEESMLVYQCIADLLGITEVKMEEIISTEFADVDITQYIPIDPVTGALTSLGSIPHLTTGDCQQCCFQKRGKCHKAHLCLFCHFPECRSKKHHTRLNRAKKRRNKKDKEVDENARDEEAETAHHPQASSSGHNRHNSRTVISL
jgi:hypothetical protein